MEDSWMDLVSQWEMGDEGFFNQSHMISCNEDKIVEQQQVISPENKPSSSSSYFSYLQSNLKPRSSFPTGYVLSFDNPVVQPLYPQQSHCVEPEAFLRTRPRVHILAERKRREELTKSIVALSATIPGLKKMDKANVVREAVNYVKQLKERVKELENHKRNECVDSITPTKKTRLSINDEATHNGYAHKLPEVKVTVLDKEVLIGIFCEKRRQSCLKILSCLNNLHLSITRTSALPFGTSTLKITIIAQMDDEYNMTIDDLVKALRQCILSLNSMDMQK